MEKDSLGRKKRPLLKYKRFLNYKFTEEEYEQLTKSLNDFKKKNNMTTTDTIKKIFLEILPKL